MHEMRQHTLLSAPPVGPAQCHPHSREYLDGLEVTPCSTQAMQVLQAGHRQAQHHPRWFFDQCPASMPSEPVTRPAESVVLDHLSLQAKIGP